MKRKYMIMLLAAAMLTLTACGSKEETAASDTQTEQAEGSVSAAEYYDSVTFDMLTSKLVSAGEYKGIEVE